MKQLTLITLCGLIFAVFGFVGTATAGTTFYFDQNQPYTRYSDSPFAGTPGMHLETFEDGLMNIPKATAIGGFVKGPSATTHSVDLDDGALDGSGSAGHSFSSGASTWITFVFAANAAGKMPSMAGLVWTKGAANSVVLLRAWDSYGNFLGKIAVAMGNAAGDSSSAQARFLGVTNVNGISRIQVASNFAGFEIDHLQFAYGFAVVPVPPAFALGAAGLAGIMFVRRRQAKKRCSQSESV